MQTLVSLAPRPGRAGYSLIEVVVVTAILALAAGLVLAGVQRVRAAAARAGCASQLRQLALAAHAAADGSRPLPAGCGYPTLSSPADLDTHAGVSWHTGLLPFLDQATLWAAADAAYRADPTDTDPAHHDVRATVVRAFLCPTEPRAVSGYPIVWPMGLASYRGVAGTAANADDGVFHPNLAVRVLDITDGTSATLMIGERPPGPGGSWGGWYSGWGDSRCVGSQLLPAGYTARPPTEYAGCSPGVPALQPGRPDDPCAVDWFWSDHPGGSHFAFADGSVRFLRYAAAPVLPYLATRSAGDIPPGWE